MANRKISELSSIATPDPADVFPIVDVSATETKKITFSDFRTALAISSANIDTEPVTAVASGSNVTIDLAQLSNTFLAALLVAKNGQILMPNGSASLPGSSWSISSTTVTVYNADAGESYMVQYIYS